MDGDALFSLIIRNKAALYAAYMPFIQGGGLFIPTPKSFRLGDKVFMVLELSDEDSTTETIAVAGKVIWLTPPRAQGYSKPGIGVQFSSSGSKTLNRLEKFLGNDWLNADKKTLTL